MWVFYCKIRHSWISYIWNYIRDTSDIFSIFSLVKISLTVIPVFPQNVSLSSRFFLLSKHSYLCNKKKITHHNICLSCYWTYNVYLLAVFTREIFFPLQDNLQLLTSRRRAHNFYQLAIEIETEYSNCFSRNLWRRNKRTTILFDKQLLNLLKQSMLMIQQWLFVEFKLSNW